MKKLILALCMIFVVIGSALPTAFADAVTFPTEMVDYDVIVSTPDGGLNIRFGPGTEYNKAMDGRIPDGVKLHISMTSGNWGYTSYNGTEGWVALKQTIRATEKPVVTPPPTPQPTVAITEAPVITPTPTVKAEEPTPIVEVIETEEDDGAMNNMRMEILLIAILVALIVMISLIIVLIINNKSKKGDA